MTTPAPVLLTDIGWRYLQTQLDGYASALALLEQRRDQDPTDVQDTGDESIRIEQHDDATQVADRLAEVRQWLDEAVALQPAEDGERIGLGSTVRVRTEDGEEASYRIVHRAEVGATDHDISVDAPVARALLDQRAGSSVEVQTPDGAQRLSVLEVAPYRPA